MPETVLHRAGLGYADLGAVAAEHADGGRDHAHPADRHPELPAHGSDRPAAHLLGDPARLGKQLGIRKVERGAVLGEEPQEAGDRAGPLPGEVG